MNIWCLRMLEFSMVSVYCFTALQSSYAEIPYTNEEITSLLQYSKNAYVESNTTGYLFTFGNDMGLSSKVFQHEKWVVIAFRGTVFDLLDVSPNSQASQNRIFDNAMYECCNDRDCFERKRKVFQSRRYISDSIFFVRNIIKIFPKKRIILTGHSLGGSLASLIGRLMGLEVLAFGSPGEKYISDSVTSNDTSRIFHLGICADPIFTGECDGDISACRIFGYVMETKCHTGKSFCFSLNLPKNVIFHKINVLEYLIRSGRNVIQRESQECSDCSRRMQEPSKFNGVMNILRTFLNTFDHT